MGNVMDPKAPQPQKPLDQDLIDAMMGETGDDDVIDCPGCGGEGKEPDGSECEECNGYGSVTL
jgi:DnaJ-class molecular chaperone